MANTHSLDLERSSSQYASIINASQTGLNISSSITIMAWIRIESLPVSNGNRHSIVYRRDSGNGGYWFNLRNNGGTQQLEFVATDSGGSEFLVQTHTMVTDIWYHVAAIWDSADGDVDFFVNGSNIGNAAGTKSTLNAQSQTLYVGAGNLGSDAFDGLLDEVAIFDDNIAESTLEGYFRGSLVGNETNLQGYWKLDNDYTDTHANGNDLTASGSPVFSTTVPFTGALDISNTTALSTNLVSHYSLEEGSGTRLDDHGANDLTDNNTVLSTTGILGDAGQFASANSEYLSITDASQSGLDILSDMTASMWVNLTSAPTSGNSWNIFGKWNSTGNQRSFIFDYVNDAGTLKIEAITSAAGSTAKSGTITKTLTTSTWFHLAFIYDASAATVDIYVDGINIGTISSLDTSLFNSTANFEIGHVQSSGAYFDGLIDQFGIWNSALTSTEILDLYNNGAALPYSSGTDYTQTLNETLTLDDTVAKQAEKVLDEIITLVDTIARETSKVLTDTVVLVDTAETNKIFTQSFSEIITLVDDLEAKISGKTFTEQITLVDSQQKYIEKTLIDTVVLVDTLTSIKVYVREFLEAIVLNDTITKQAGKVLDEEITLVDDLEIQSTYARALNEIITLVDTIAKTAGHIVTDSISLVDTFSRVGTFARELDEKVTIELRFQGLLNGQDMSWFKKYTNKAGTWISKYLQIP